MSEKVKVRWVCGAMGPLDGSEAYCGSCNEYLPDDTPICPKCGNIPIWQEPSIFVTGMLMFDDNEYNAIMVRPAGTLMMNQIIINNWNNTVSPDDTVFILGGVGNMKYLSKLNGKKYVMFNLHDINYNNVRSQNDLERLKLIIRSELAFYTVAEGIDEEEHIKLCIDYTNLSDDPEITNIAALGGLEKIGKNFIDVSMDAWGFIPCSMNTINNVIQNMKKDLYRKYAINGSVYDAISLLSQRKEEPQQPSTLDWWEE